MIEANELIKKLNLIQHPEGGYYSEQYRSSETIAGRDRQLMTSIYFLLCSNNVSKFHRIKSDEIWFFHAGSPLIVHTLSDKGHIENLVGLDLSKGHLPQFLVPKDTIFGSSVLNENAYSLVSCVVSPGFDFEDFELFTKEDLLPLYPSCEEIINFLT